MAKPIDKKFLEGLTFRGATQEEVEEDGKTVLRSRPFSRDLTQDDVLDWVDNGDHVVMATADGRKYKVPKGGKKADDKKE